MKPRRASNLGFLLAASISAVLSLAEKPARLGEFDVICSDGNQTENPAEKFESQLLAPIFKKKFHKHVIGVPSGKKTVRLHCDAWGNPRPKIRWFWNGKPLAPAPRHYHKSCKLCRFVLTLRNLTPDMNGIYACEVWNAKGKVRREFTLR